MHCCKCGNEAPANSKFCNTCGAPIIKKEESQITSNNTNSNKSSIPNNGQHNDLKNLEDDVVLATKCTLITALVLVIIITLWFTPFIRNSKFLLFLMILVAFGLFWLLLWFMKEFLNARRNLKIAKEDYSKYLNLAMQRKKLQQEKLAEQKYQLQEEEKAKEAIAARKAENKAKGIVFCAKCGSASIATINRGYSVVSGFIGSGKPVNVCQVCGYKWPLKK